MKVLYLSGATGADYMADMLFHGLRTLLGPDLVDVNRLDFMYRDWPHPPFYSIYGLLTEPDGIDRTDIEAKIANHYFDLIVYGSIHRFRQCMDLVWQHYPPNKVVYIDGEDDHSTIILGNTGIYFKRELADIHPSSYLPIQFCIPKEKIRPIDLSRKTRLMSPLIPGDTSTYIYYGDESKYYDQYSESYFGRTKKKGGWDCCRHHEILAAGTLPYFQDFENCPPLTLFNFNRSLIKMAKEMYDNWSDDHWQVEVYETVLSQLQNFSLTTTEAMAKYVLDTVGAA